jgi:hypothetical protein
VAARRSVGTIKSKRVSLRRADYYAGDALRAERAGRQRRMHLLNRTDRPASLPGEAEVKYLDGDFRVIRPGVFVRCAVTGAEIPLEELRYWSVDLQEAYVSPEAVLQRHAATYPHKK